MVQDRSCIFPSLHDQESAQASRIQILCITVNQLKLVHHFIITSADKFCILSSFFRPTFGG